MINKTPRKLYKFQSLDNKHSIENLAKNQIWFSKPKELNDPFDSAIPAKLIVTDNEEEMAKFYTYWYYADQMKTAKVEEITKLALENFQNAKQISIQYPELSTRINKILDKLSKQRVEEYTQMGVACFTRRLKNILMWSHYADGHRGFCLEFNTEYLQKVTKVIYDKSYPTLSPLDMLGGTGRINEPLYTKSKEWGYEKEWRMIAKKGDCAFKYNPKALTAIYFGCLMEEKDKMKLASMPEISSTKRYQMRLSKTEFGLDFVPYPMS